ncbi:hypothetical protein HA466_0143380 [Hirschfeldia incana]|nr:hypothetical protein HA466_0143380 [Hirschfeldia incana]
MDHAPKTKRHRHNDDVTSSIQNPNSLPNFDLIISSLLLSSSPSLSSSSPQSFDQALDQALASASDNVSDQDRLVDRAVELASFLLDSTKRCFRKRASAHNSNSWAFPRELTIKIFLMLDKKSLMQAMACCTLFHKCAMDPLCYSHIELKDNNVDDGVVRTMIHRAGNKLRSLELGQVSSAARSSLSSLTGSCLYPLFDNHLFIGNGLRRVHLYNLISTYGAGLDKILACSNITDLKIVGLSIFDEVFMSLTAKSCRRVEHLFVEARGFQNGSIVESRLLDLVTTIPNLTSLTVIGFGIDDNTAHILIEGSHKLKHMNLSRTSLIKGRFLRDLGHSIKDRPLETIILRDCTSLKEKEVLQFLNSLLKGKLRFIRHIDVSNIRGLVCDGGKRSDKPNFPLEKLKEERPNVKLVAEFSTSLSSSETLLRGISYVSSDEEDAWFANDDDDMEDFIVDQDVFL